MQTKKPMRKGYRVIDAQRIKTMKERLGEAVELIDDDRYLPMFRNRQIHHPELFAFSIELAKKKNNPARYFAALWGSKTLAKTLDWLQKLINLAKGKAIEKAHQMADWAKEKKARIESAQPMNRAARRKYEQMRKKLLTNPPPMPAT